MTQYQRKEKIVNAVQWFKGGEAPVGSITSPSGSVYVHTSDGKVLLTQGDYVLSGGERVVSKAYFEARYEVVVQPVKKKVTVKKKAVSKTVIKKKK